MISVCMATYNGGHYIREQLDSILMQLGEGDEIIISDDSSTDDTLEIIASYADNRIKIFPGQHFHSPVFNFENALKQAKGDYVFLSDQDDVWKLDKVQVMLEELKRFALVVSDCMVVDKEGGVIQDSFCFSEVRKTGVVSNIWRNNYLGCCMAFRREVLDKALPFPSQIAMHDIWLGLCASVFFSTTFISDKLICYRRHGNNASATAEASNLPWTYRISYRLYFICQLVKRFFGIKFYKIWK